MLSVTIARTGTDLVIDDRPGDDLVGFWLPEGGITWPSFPMRTKWAPDSDVISGRELLSAVPDAGQITLEVYAKASTTTALVALMDELEAATSQFTYDLTIDLDGFTRTWQAFAELPQWGQLDSGEAKAKLISGTVVIPLNPYVPEV